MNEQSLPLTLLYLTLSLGGAYIILVLILEGVIWKLQPDMEGAVTLHVKAGDAVIKRTLYGLEYENNLYVSSNHWFRSWYYAILEEPSIQVERSGDLHPYVASSVEGEELSRVKQAYNMGLVLRVLCGFAPPRFLRLDPQK